MDYDTRDVDSIDMKACYPTSFQGMGEAKPYFERFGHPSHHMTRVAINGALPRDIGTGFAEVQEWEFEANCHPVIPAWFGRHFADAGWAPTPLLAFLVESGFLKSLKVRKAIIPFGRQTEVWLPDDRDEACSVIGKFTQGSVADGKMLTRRLVIDQWELDFLVRDTRQSSTLVGAPQSAPLGISSIIMMGPSPSNPILGQACWPTPTSTSFQCFQGLHQMTRSGWPPTAFTSGNPRLRGLKGLRLSYP